MQRHMLTLLAAGLVWSAQVQAEDAANNDLEKLQGAWMIVSDVRAEKTVATDQGAAFTMKGDKFTTQAGDKVLRRGTLKLDPARKPKTIDVTYTAGEFQGQTLHGVYKLQGDTWLVCYGLPGQERPKKLPAKPGKGQMLLTLERIKP